MQKPEFRQNMENIEPERYKMCKTIIGDSLKKNEELLPFHFCIAQRCIFPQGIFLKNNSGTRQPRNAFYLSPLLP